MTTVNCCYKFDGNYHLLLNEHIALSLVQLEPVLTNLDLKLKYGIWR